MYNCIKYFKLSICTHIILRLFSYLFLYLHVHGFNIDTNNPIVFVDPSKTNDSTFSSYFGYTIVMFPGNRNSLKKWIKIGAPRGQDPHLNAFKRSGIVYHCPYMQGCNPTHVFDNLYTREDELNNSWIGGTMDISYKYETLVICAFKRATNDVPDFSTLGGCFLSSFDQTESYRSIKDLPVTYSITENGVKMSYYGYAQYGFSAHFSNDDNQLILGAPGVRNWAGTVVLVEENDRTDNPVARRRILSNTNNMNYITSVSGLKTSDINDIYDYFGYAVTSGHFYGDGILYYVASSPRYFYYGKVVIFQFNGGGPVKDKESKKGGKYGEYFGASLAAGDINNDGYDELIVGAPYHAVKTYNEGAVYIFLGQKHKVNVLKKDKVLQGSSTNGQFGSAIMYLGDITGDGYGDVAIGAPYEEEFSGVLYIYKGSNGGIDNAYSQRIVGKDILAEIRGFGISISRPVDIDENGIKDIAVGAHMSANAVLLRSKPVVVIHYNIEPFPKKLVWGANNFSLEICYRYSAVVGEREKKDVTVGINRTIEVDRNSGRAIISKKNQKIKTLRILEEGTCESITIFITSSPNFISPITVSLSYDLTNVAMPKEIIYISSNISGNDSFCLRCPVLDRYRSDPLTKVISVPFTVICGDDDICQAKLSVDVKISGLENDTFVVGSSDYVNLEATVKNTGETAYYTRLEITLPNMISFGKIPTQCMGNEYNNSVVICDVDNDPLKKDSQKTINIDVYMKNLNNHYEDEFNILLRVLTTSNNENSDTTLYKLKLRRKADVTIFGSSEEQNIPLDNTTFMTHSFTHTYQVEKIGPSSLEKVVVQIAIPHAVRSGDNEKTFIRMYQPKGTFSGQPLMCTSNFSYLSEVKIIETSEKLTVDPLEKERRKRQIKPTEGTALTSEVKDNGTSSRTINCDIENIVCSNILCYLGNFETKEVVSITVKMMLDSEAISELFKENVITYTTHGSVIIERPAGFIQSGNRPDSADVITVFLTQTVEEVALWIIILSVIAGLLLLVLIVLGLMKFGFFKRAKKEELKNLKAEAEHENDVDSTDEHLESPNINSSNEGLVDDTGEN